MDDGGTVRRSRTAVGNVPATKDPTPGPGLDGLGLGVFRLGHYRAGHYLLNTATCPLFLAQNDGLVAVLMLFGLDAMVVRFMCVFGRCSWFVHC